MMLVLLALPAVTSVWLEDLPFSVQRASWKRVLLRYGFLLFKSVLVMGITYYLSLDLTYGQTTGYVAGAAGVQFLVSLLIGLLGMRWAILDQQHRCPICLRKVTHPARVGMASRTFLAWNGTEMICTEGTPCCTFPVFPPVGLMHRAGSTWTPPGIFSFQNEIRCLLRSLGPGDEFLPDRRLV